MELRLLATELEREIFAKCLTQARATRGVKWRETARSRLGGAHLRFGSLYALYESERDPTERMLGGFISHDLATLPPSLPKPDLGHLPPQSVIEGGELWSLSTGVGTIARHLAAAVAGIVQAKAILLYPMFRPVDLSTSYAQLNFVNASAPLLWPYAETADGGEIWTQPMILQGEKLEEYIRSGFEFLFKNSDGRQVLRFDRPFPGPAAAREIQMLQREESTAVSAVPAFDRPNGNGTASPQSVQR